MEEKTGHHLIKQWNKQQYTIKGWRSQQKMAKYIQRIVDRNVFWNTKKHTIFQLKILDSSEKTNYKTKSTLRLHV